MGGTALIAASKNMCVHVGVCRGRGECVCVWCVREVGGWVRKGVCGWDSLHFCCRVCV